jgi:hypothetical protein
MTNNFVKGALSGMFLLVSANLAFADNEQFQKTEGLFYHETNEQRLQRMYRAETRAAAQEAQSNGVSFQPPSYQDWKSSPTGTFEGYPTSYDGLSY